MKPKKKYLGQEEENAPQYLQDPAMEYTALHKSTHTQSPVQYTPEQLRERAISGIQQMKEGKYTSHAEMIDVYGH